MKRLLLGISSLVLVASCSKEEAPVMSKRQMKHAIDSLSAERIKEVNYRAQRELEYRLKIELKIRVDSIMHARDSIARLSTPATPDTAKAAK